MKLTWNVGSERHMSRDKSETFITHDFDPLGMLNLATY